eukprot:187340_1
MFKASYFDEEKSIRQGVPSVTSDTFTTKVMLCGGDAISAYDGYVMDFMAVKKSMRALCKDLDGNFIYAEKSKILNCVVKEDGIRQISLSNIDGGSSGGPVLIPSEMCKILPLKQINSYHLAMYFFTEFLKILQIKFLHLRKVDEVKVWIESSSGWSQAFTAEIPETKAELESLDF